ncbi:C39 family peptidase [Pontibacillus sp. HMF3514]|uniref:C39 family peptidase n=1 Tax=Pontibacillus sp. HMF3514 TaxID=2692425 RepID=UPI001F1BC07D|nr:C39 family peptidase [Pontibacillus sp. HMF3514]
MLATLTLGVVTLSILLMLGANSNKIQSQYKRLLRWYMVFSVGCALALAIMTVHQQRDVWTSLFSDWFLNTEERNHVAASSLGAMELEPIVPLIEQYHLKEKVNIDAPVVRQYPELPRGCEVTSLTMLLRYHNIESDKMTLAEQIQKDPTPFKAKGDKLYFGNPHKGFVGNMYDLNQPGYGVYNEPIEKLARTYAKDRVENFSGESFYKILEHLNENRPVWVITNTTYKKLPEELFQTWLTPDGPESITMKEHSVLVTGYDKEFIYFNDPLGKNKKAPISDFREAWVQMGKQAITIK